MTPADAQRRSMATYARPPRDLRARGRGRELFDDEGQRLPRLHRRAGRDLARATPTRRWPTAVAEQAATLSHVSNLYSNALAPEVAATLDRLIGGGTEPGPAARCSSATRAPRPTSARSSWPAAGAARVATGSSRPLGSFHGRTLATLAATGQPEKHVPFAPVPGGLRPRPLRRPRRDGGGARGRRRRRPSCSSRSRARAGSIVPSSDYLAGVRELCDERGRPADRRRDPDRARPDRALVRLPGPGPRARHRDDGQGARQRHAGRGLLGPGRGGGGVRARGPRLDLRRPAPGPVGGRATLAVMEAEDVLRPGPAGRCPAGGRAWRALPGVRRGPGGRAAAGGACWPATPRQGGGRPGARARACS